MSDYKLYFAYGSNLNQTRMKKRCPGSFVWARARLQDYQLLFGGYSETWDGAVANVVPWDGHYVDGVIYKVTSDDIRRLDRAEGHPRAYKRKNIVVEAFLNDGIYEENAFTYVKPPKKFNQELDFPQEDYRRLIGNAYAMLDFNDGPLGFGSHHSMYPRGHSGGRGGRGR